MSSLKSRLHSLLRWSEKYTKTDMVYLTKGSFWLYLNFIVVNVLTLGLSIAFAHLISKETYGSYQFILAISSILGALTLNGMNSAVTRAVAQGYEGAIRSSIPVQLKYNVIASLAAIAVASYYAIHGNLLFAGGITILGIFIPITSTFNTYQALFNGRKDFKALFLFTAIPVALYTLTMFISLFFIKNPAELIFINLGTNSLIAFSFFWIAIRLYKPNNTNDAGSLSYGKHLSFASVISSIAAQADVLLVFHFIGPVNLAIYSFASTIPEKIGSLLKGLNVLAFPKFSNRTAKEIKATLSEKTLRFAFAFLVIALIYIALAPYIFTFLFPQYTESIRYSQGYAIALVLTSLASIPLTAITALGARKQIYIFNTISSLLSIILMIILTIFYGIWGLIIARGLSGLANYALIMRLFQKTANDYANSH